MREDNSAQLDITILTFQQIQSLSNRDHLYVVNLSSEHIKPNGGDICISIKAGDINADVVIPNTWIPWDLGAQVPVKDVINNINFRKYVTMGFLAVVDETEAQALLKNPDVQAQLSLVNSRVAKSHRNVNIVEGQKLKLRTSRQRSEIDAVSLQTMGDQTEGVSIAAVEIVNNTDVTADERYAMVLNHSEQLTQKDWDYIVANNPDDERILNVARRHGSSAAQ